MTLGFLGFTLDTIGKVMVAFTAIMVHYRFLREHQVNERVFKIMKREQAIGVLGVILIIIGYFLQIPIKI